LNYVNRMKNEPHEKHEFRLWVLKWRWYLSLKVRVVLLTYQYNFCFECRKLLWISMEIITEMSSLKPACILCSEKTSQYWAFQILC